MGPSLWALAKHNISEGVCVVAVAPPYFSFETFRKQWCEPRGYSLLQAASGAGSDMGRSIAFDIAEKQHQSNQSNRLTYVLATTDKELPRHVRRLISETQLLTVIDNLGESSL